MTDEKPALSTLGAWALALTATLTMAVSYIDRQTLAAIAPSVEEALGFKGKDAYYGYLTSAFAVAYLVGAPLAGLLVDRLGARRGLLGAVLVWSAVAAAHALAPTFGVLLFLRVMLGLAESPSFPAAAQTIQRVLPPASRARGFGVLFTGSSIGAAIAPPLATWLAHDYGVGAAFLGTAAAGLIWVPVWLALAFRAPARAALDLRVVAPPAKYVAHPGVLRAMVAVLASAPLLAFLLQWNTKFLVREFHITQLEAAPFLIAPPLCFDLGAIGFGHLTSLANARGTRGVPKPLLACAALAMLAGVAIPFAPSPLYAVLAMSVAMAGGGGMYALPMSDLAARVPPGLVAAGGGMCAATQSVAQIAANLAIGHSVTATSSYRSVVIGLALWVVPGSIAWLLWRAPPPYDAQPGERA